ncbi:uncharacterized protein EDB91DRAFT_682681 [Suillus paluster]|uniref:uncharacterized protein n=1 Tax=Suillus paluster TaxID=48578 RepID=UPI001B87675E|nr:uncharacterized protein EDB91DRAFT_682681 [Suillus paluster]KAG1750325.1 hypothetical protein EDB91DRAFT_682681 [Suillus paluster]
MIHLYIRHTDFVTKGISRPTNPNTPVVCVGPGKGIVPMRAASEQCIHEGYNSIYCLTVFWLLFCTQGSALSLGMVILCRITKSPLSRCLFS